MAEEPQDIIEILSSQDIEGPIEVLIKEEIDISGELKANILPELSNEDVIIAKNIEPETTSSGVMKPETVSEPKDKETKMVSVASKPTAEKRKIDDSIASTDIATVALPPAKKRRTVKAKAATKKVAVRKKKVVQKKVSKKQMKKITKQVAEPVSKEKKTVSAKKLPQKRKMVSATSTTAARKRKIAASIPSTAKAAVTKAATKKVAVKKRVSKKQTKKITKRVAVKRAKKA